jgi:hypothetical protein
MSSDPNGPSSASVSRRHAKGAAQDTDADAEASQWAGTWIMPNTAGKVHTTIALRGGNPTVVRLAESVGDQEVFEVRTSRWKGGALEWTYFVPSTRYLVTFSCSGVEDDALVCRWRNDRGASGKTSLPRVGGEGGGNGGGPSATVVSAELRAWEGVWMDPDTAYKTQMTIVLRDGVPTHVRSAEPMGDREVYELRGSTWSSGSLRFSHLVPSTQYLVTYACSAPRGDRMSCQWFNDRNASGAVQLERVGNVASSAAPPAAPPPSQPPPSQPPSGPRPKDDARD